MLKLSPLAATFTCGLFAVGLLAGCATTAPSEQAPSPAVSVDRQAAAVSACAAGKDCAIGDIGPGGGIVFYDAGSVQPWGRYLEAAPTGWNGGSEDPKAQWCDNTDSDVDGGYNNEIIGVGKANTVLIKAVCSSGAANLASAYTGGGKTNWFLPSKDELNELYKQRETVGGFAVLTYWSSSQSYRGYAWNQYFPMGPQQNLNHQKHGALSVRPIRAF